MDSAESIRIEQDVPFEKELENLLNRKCMENGSNTPDYILAEYMMGCLRVYENAVNAREKWYGRDLHLEHTRYGLPPDPVTGEYPDPRRPE